MMITNNFGIRKAMLCTTFSITTCMASENVSSFLESDFRSVKIDVDSGAVVIEASSTPTTQWSSPSPTEYEISSKVVDGKLLVVSRKLPGVSRAADVNWHIKIPNDKPVDIDIGNGKLHTSTYTGIIDANFGNGFIDIESPLQKLSLNGGNIRGKVLNLMGNGIFDIGSGSLDFVWSMLPASLQTLNFNIGAGHVTMSCPHDMSISAARFSSSPYAFEVVSDFANSENPLVNVTGTGGSGSIKIKKK